MVAPLTHECLPPAADTQDERVGRYGCTSIRPMKPLEPVLTLHLFPEERAALLDLLGSLSAAQWDAPTVCAGWSVKDIAAHLLADDLGRLARGRDSHAAAAFEPSGSDNVEAQLLAFINHQNEAWVAAARRLSPRVLIDLFRWSGDETQAYFESLDMFAIGEPVTGRGQSPRQSGST